MGGGGERTSRLEAGKVMCDRLESSIERQNLTPGQGNWAGVRALCCCDSGAAERRGEERGDIRGLADSELETGSERSLCAI